MDLKEEFMQWWHASYPNTAPSSHTITSHVAFAEHVMEQKRIKDFRELAILMNEEPCH